MRKSFFWLHLTAGLLAGSVILIMSATGVLLAYERQILAWADRTDAARPPDEAGARLPIDTLIAAVSAAARAPVTAVAVSSSPGSPALVTAGQRTFAVNAYTGAVLGEASPGLRRFFRMVTTWHRYLGAAGPLRQTMRAVTGWANVAFLVIVAVGAYLWLPRHWSRSQFRQVAWFKGGVRGRARDFNWHNAIGVWSAIPLLVIVAGALPISFPWAHQAVYRLVGETPPAAPSRLGPIARGDGTADGARGAERRGESAVPLEPLWQRAEQQVSGWRTITARLGGGGPVAFTIDRGSGGQPQMRGTLTLARESAAIISWENYETQSAGRRLRTFLRFAHTGEYFGIAGQTVAGIASAGAVVLVWTGMSLAVRRFRGWWLRRRSSTASPDAARLTAA